jgi:hypothetical protein
MGVIKMMRNIEFMKITIQFFGMNMGLKSTVAVNRYMM